MNTLIRFMNIVVEPQLCWSCDQNAQKVGSLSNLRAPIRCKQVYLSGTFHIWYLWLGRNRITMYKWNPWSYKQHSQQKLYNSCETHKCFVRGTTYKQGSFCFKYSWPDKHWRMKWVFCFLNFLIFGRLIIVPKHLMKVKLNYYIKSMGTHLVSNNFQASLLLPHTLHTLSLSSTQPMGLFNHIFAIKHWIIW